MNSEHLWICTSSCFEEASLVISARVTIYLKLVGEVDMGYRRIGMQHDLARPKGTDLTLWIYHARK